MKLSQINLFIAVVENQFNISRTAESKFIAQSALSRQLKNFEAELGQALFERGSKRLIKLTIFGEEVYAQAKLVQTTTQNITSIADSWGNRNQVIAIATTHTQAKYFLPPVISDLRKKFPDIKIRIEQSNPENLVRLLEHKKADIAICTELISQRSNLTYEPCYDWSHALVLPKKHALAHFDSVHIKQLQEFPIVTYVFGFTGRNAIQKAFDKAGLEPNVVFSASDTDVIKNYVRIGFGVGIIAKMAFEESDNKDLVLREVYPKFRINHTGVAWLKGAYQTKGQKMIVELLLNQGKLMKAL